MIEKVISIHLKLSCGHLEIVINMANEILVELLLLVGGNEDRQCVGSVGRLDCLQVEQGGVRVVEKEPIRFTIKLSDICMVIIAVFVILAYFNGWG